MALERPWRQRSLATGRPVWMKGFDAADTFRAGAAVTAPAAVWPGVAALERPAVGSGGEAADQRGRQERRLLRELSCALPLRDHDARTAAERVGVAR